MKAIVQDRYGPPDVLEPREVERPVPALDDVLVQVCAAGVDQGVWHLMAGQPYLVRLMGFGFRAPKIPVRGSEVAGRVDAVGENAAGFQPGDEVFGSCEGGSGSFAEYACARADRLAPKPANLDFEHAAAVPVSGVTALQALRDRAEVRAGQRVLVIGAGGGVGTFSVQLAKAFGAEVTGVCSTAKQELVRSLGADEAIDYTQEDFADGRARWDVILDTAGNRSLSHLRRALAPHGTLVIVGGEGGGRWLGGFDRQVVRAPVVSLFVGQRLRPVIGAVRADDLQVLRELIEAGEVTPVVDRVYPLSEAAAAVRYLREGHARGKIVLSVPG